MIDEIVRLKVKPNVLLYAFEASRYYFVVTLAILLVLIPVIHFETGLPIGGLMLKIVLTTYCVLLSIFFALVLFVAHCMEFIVTSKKVIVRASLMGRVKDNISIPIRSIKTIEIRSYNARYGSVYFKCDGTSPLGRTAKLVARSGWVPIFWSMPSSSPPLSGFYGFRHFHALAKLVAELQAAT